jgi:protein TonB
MAAGMSRFVLLSAALHLGVLAILSQGPVRPAPYLPTTLSVTLSEPFTALSDPLRQRRARQTPPRSGTSSVVNPVKQTKPTPSPPRQITQDVSPLAPPSAQIADEAPAHASNIAGATPSPATIQQFDEPVVKEEADNNIAHSKSIETSHHLDTTRLTSQLKNQLRAALVPYFAYPMMARRHGWQGQVRVGLRVEADGRLSHVRIAHSSGYRLLDSAALAALNRINTLPKVADWLDGRHFDMVLPIDYRLIDGQS